ncbi:MAG: hypothetical protein A2Y38_07210 [Spirochaetes bacterium GWB1_59_5]|nr:MAG: hypothetical protein A2Y38_07210 [Spirochaetes bacterium GWB1_59_5]
MQRIRTALLNLATHEPSTRKALLPLTRTAAKWEKLPEGWTDDSVDLFWKSLTEGGGKHKVTECIKQMEGKDIDDPGAFCASLADKVLGPEWRSKSASGTKLGLTALPLAKLPKVIQRVLAEVRVVKRQISVTKATAFSMYSAGGDGAKGFTALVDLDTNQYKIVWGAWGGGALGQAPSPVDDVNQQKKPLPDHLVIVQGEQGGREPYVGITVTPTGFDRLLAASGATRLAGLLSPPMTKPIRLSPKEITRAESMGGGDVKVTFAARPQASGGYLVAAVDVATGLVLFSTMYELVESKADIQNAVRRISRNIEKNTGLWSKMTDTSRHRVANLAGTYADYVYEGDDKFLRAAAKSIRRVAGGHAERVEVVRQKGRSPYLVYEGQDGADMNLELTFHVFPTSASQVKVGWFGTSVLRGRVSDDANYNWGELTPDTLVNIFSGLFGGGARLASSEPEVEAEDAKVEKTAFNKENAPELVSQLLAVLAKAELKDAVNQIKQKGIPDLVSKAWAKRSQG